MFHTAKTCPEDFVKCKDDLQCLHVTQLCNGRRDCRDGSDENKDICNGKLQTINMYSIYTFIQYHA